MRALPPRDWSRKRHWIVGREKEMRGKGLFVDEVRPPWLGWFDVARWHDNGCLGNSRRLTTSRDWMITNLNLFSQDNAWDAVWGCLWNTIRFSTSVGQKKNLSSSQAVAPRHADFARPMLYHRRRENSWANWGLPIVRISNDNSVMRINSKRMMINFELGPQLLIVCGGIIVHDTIC